MGTDTLPTWGTQPPATNRSAAMSTKYKLVYANFRGRAEFIRLALHAGGIEFEDYRFPSDQFDAEKKKSPNCKLPYLEIDGLKFPQSRAVANYVAKKGGLMGDNDMEAMLIEIVCNECVDKFDEMVSFFFEKNDTSKDEKKEKLKTSIPVFLNLLETYLDNNAKWQQKEHAADYVPGFFVGSKLSLADITVYDMIDSLKKFDENCCNGMAKIEENRAKVEAFPALKKYLEERPKDTA